MTLIQSEMGRAGKRRSRQLEAALRMMKVRLSVVVRTTGDGTAVNFAAEMGRHGRQVEPTTISRWIDADNQASPSLDDLWVIRQVRPTVRADWLLGLLPAESLDEQWIESQEVVKAAYVKLMSLIKRAAKLALVLFFVYGGTACVMRHVEVSDRRMSWVQLVTKLTIANSVEPVDLAYVEETIAASMLPKWLEGGRVNKTGGGQNAPLAQAPQRRSPVTRQVEVT